MKLLIKISVPALVLFLQSCNMSKHYANMRIDHDNEQISSQKKEKIVSTPPNNPTNLHSDSISPVFTNTVVSDSIILPRNEMHPPPSEWRDRAGVPARTGKPAAKSAINAKQKHTTYKKTYYVNLNGKKNIFKMNSIKRKIRKLNSSSAKATKDFDGALSRIILAGIIIGIISGIVSGSAGVGFLVALGIVLLIIVGVIIGIGLIIMFILGGIIDFFSNR